VKVSKSLSEAKLTDVQWVRRFRRALFVTHILQVMPFVRYVGLNGSMATLNAHEGSDIDLYIATAKNRLYIGRVFTRAIVLVTGVGRTKNRIANRICLNRYGTVESLAITPHDAYHAEVFSAQMPLYDSGLVHEKYLAANHWWRQYGHTGVHKPAFLRPGAARFFQWAFEVILFPVAYFLEIFLYNVHRERTKNARGEKQSLVKIERDTICFVERSWESL
jgi:hypothetical protein